MVLAAGDGRLSEEAETVNSYKKVTDAISRHTKTITLSVGQLTTGVNIPEWSGVLMLSNMKSPSLYMQAAFRAQNPCDITRDGQRFRKENAYVFDFDPARTLVIFDDFANNLRHEYATGGGSPANREENIRRLLNFFPVIAEDEEGKMVELDARAVLSIPRSIKSQEVVNRGFLCNFLFIIRKTKCSEKIKRSVPFRKTKCSFFGFPPHNAKRLRFLWGVSVSKPFIFSDVQIKPHVLVTCKQLFGAL